MFTMMLLNHGGLCYGAKHIYGFHYIPGQEVPAFTKKEHTAVKRISRRGEEII